MVVEGHICHNFEEEIDEVFGISVTARGLRVVVMIIDVIIIIIFIVIVIIIVVNIIIVLSETVCDSFKGETEEGFDNSASACDSC